MLARRLFLTIPVAFVMTVPQVSWSHDPVFSPGPHTIYKGGVEYHLEGRRTEAGGNAEKEYELAALYGITGDWTAGIELPYIDGDDEDGAGNVALRTKYRFWRDDRLRVQESAALLGRVFLDTYDDAGGSGATDVLTGVTYGYESVTWYRWASARYRYNGENEAGIDRGDKVFLDTVVGIRLRELDYRQPDAVWMLELNGEHTQRSELGGRELDDTGGTELFLSPGLMWTYRNVAIKPGVQIPIYSNLYGDQDATDFRALVELEVHL